MTHLLCKQFTDIENVLNKVFETKMFYHIECILFILVVFRQTNANMSTPAHIFDSESELNQQAFKN